MRLFKIKYHILRTHVYNARHYMYHITDIVTKAAVGITAVINLFPRLLLNFRIIPRVYQIHTNTIICTIYAIYMRIVRGFETCVVGRVFGPHESRHSLQLARSETKSKCLNKPQQYITECVRFRLAHPTRARWRYRDIIILYVLYFRINFSGGRLFIDDVSYHYT